MADALAERFSAAVLRDSLQLTGAQVHLDWFLPELGAGAWFVCCNMAEFDRALTRWEKRRAVSLPCWLDTAQLLHKSRVKWMPLADVRQLTNDIVRGIEATPAGSITVTMMLFPGAITPTHSHYCRVVGVCASSDVVPEWFHANITMASAYIPRDALMSALFQAANQDTFQPEAFMLLVTTVRADKCRRCGVAGNKVCASCGVEKYCSSECQRAAWHKHRHVCARDKALFAFAVTMLHTLGPKPVPGLKTQGQYK